MKYLYSLLFNTLLTLLMLSSVSSATVSPNQLSLGGIHLGDSIDYVYSIYGKPHAARLYKDNPAYYEYDYQNGLLIKFWNESTPKNVVDIQVTERNGFATPAGVEVGMNSDVLLNLYGKPDNHRARNVFHYWTYYNREDSSQYLRFTIITDKIAEIKLHQSE